VNAFNRAFRGESVSGGLNMHYLETYGMQRRLADSYVSGGFGSSPIEVTEIRLLIDSPTVENIRVNLRDFQIAERTSMSSGDKKLYTNINGHIRIAMDESHEYAALIDIIQQQRTNVRSLSFNQAAGNLKRGDWENMLKFFEQQKLFNYQKLDISRVTANMDAHLAWRTVDIDEVIDAIKRVLDEIPTNLHSINQNSAIIAISRLTNNELNDYVSNIMIGKKTYNYVTQEVSYNATNVDSIYRSIFGLPNQYDIPDYIMNLNINSESKAENYRGEIKQLIVDSPQYIFLQYLIANGYEDLAIDTYISRRVSGGFSPMDAWMHANQLKHDGALSYYFLTNDIERDYNFKFSNIYVEKWQKELYVHIALDLPFAIKVADAFAINRYIPIFEPSYGLSMND
jgi:hypothetical protein